MVAAPRIPVVVATLLAAQCCALAQSLPAPTGSFGVGRVALVCTDDSRIEPLDPKAAARRIAVKVWYPAERSAAGSGVAATYLDVAAFERAIGTDGLKKQLGDAYEAIRSGSVVTHAVERAPFAASLQRAPVLLFSPGGGMISDLYTAQMEDLASHGYVVAALTHSYDGFLTLFPDGSSIAYDSKRWPVIPSFEGVANFNQLEWHTDDLLVVLDELARLKDLPFAGHLDLAHVGAFGHSFGGVAAAHACQKDRRILACLNEDGAMAMKPFYLDPRGWGMDQAFLLIERPPNREPLTEADLAQMKVTRERAMEIIARLNADRDRALGSTGKGSYRVMLRRDLTTHMSFSDLPVLSAANGEEAAQGLHVLRVIQSYVLAFFDRSVRGMDVAIPGAAPGSARDAVIEGVEWFGPAKRSE